MRLGIRLGGVGLALLLLPIIALAQPALRFEDEFAPYVRANSEIEFEGHVIAVEFISIEGFGFLRLTRRGDGAREFYEFRGPGNLLPVLADRRYDDLWPAIEEWAGEDLKSYAETRIDLLQDAMRNGLVAQPTDTSSVSLSPVARNIYELSNAYFSAGRVDQAVDVLKEAADQFMAGSGRSRIDAALLRLRIAGIFESQGRTERALAYLRAAERDFANTDMVTNFTINRAAILAEQARYQEALEAIELASMQFERSAPGIDDLGDRIPGSNRHFDWIRACALAGLGHEREARELMDGVVAAPDPDPEGWGPVLDATDEIALRAEICMRDHDRLVSRIVRQVEGGSLVADVWFTLQPGYRHHSEEINALLAGVRADPRVVSAIEDRMRVLPDSYIPALNSWRETR